MKTQRSFSLLFFFLLSLLFFSLPQAARSQKMWERYRDSALTALAGNDTLAGLAYLTKAAESHPNLALLDGMEYDRDFLISEDLAELYDRQGELFAALGRYDEAGTGFTYSLYFYDMNAPVWFRRANVWSALEMWEGALSDLNEAIFLDSAFHEAWRLRAEAYVGQGAWAEAAEDLTKAIELVAENPADYPEYYEERSAVWLKLGEEKKAAADKAAALRLREKNKTE